MKNVLVTGGAGFIGSHLSQVLLEKGYGVRVLDNLSSGKQEWIPAKAEFIQGDITDLTICQAAIKDIQGVFHCAAMSRAAPSNNSVEICTESNIVGTQNILIAAREAGIEKLIYSGSSTYYGNQPAPHSEYETKSEFLNFYALSKYVGEKYCLLFDELFNVPCIILRYFNVYGPRQPTSGEYALVLGIFLERWKNGEILEIHGEGTQRRDFIHVKDVVAANIAAFESPHRHEIFNVGSGTNISVKELANLISPHQTHIARRKADAEVTLADIRRIQDKLQWTPRILLEDGIEEMMAFIKQEKRSLFGCLKDSVIIKGDIVSDSGEEWNA